MFVMHNHTQDIYIGRGKSRLRYTAWRAKYHGIHNSVTIPSRRNSQYFHLVATRFLFQHHCRCKVQSSLVYLYSIGGAKTTGIQMMKVVPSTASGHDLNGAHMLLNNPFSNG